MKRIGLLMLVTCSVLAGRDTRANGGGYAFGVKFTGSLAPFQASGAELVRITDEKLQIDLRGSEAAVVVRYTMRNQTDHPVTVKFGFPVEAVHEDDTDDESPSDAAQALRDAMRQLKAYSVVANGSPVKADLVFEPFASGKIKPFPGSESLKNIVGWMVSEVTFPASKPIPLEIRYAADYQVEGTYVSDDDARGPLTFRYRLSTGGIWNGPIETGSVTVKADGIPPSEVEILKPRGHFKRKGKIWTWEFRNLEPTLADDISINASPAYFSYGGRNNGEGPEATQSYLERLGKWAEGHKRFKAVASSTLPPKTGRSYEASSLAKFDEHDPPGRPWCEGVPGPGIGEYVDIRPTTPRPLAAIGILSGFQSWVRKEEKLFEKNAHPSRLKIILNGEHRMVATLGDKQEEQLIPITDYTKPVSSLRIVVTDVYPGSQYPDTCISKILLYDLLDKKPDIKHAR